ncbi:acyl-CoA N-acyltransferase [Leucogyrophana mollusca]|uniref:Acyl-CoA N-acyltransferase n=1 Tax=Leucogyrophana mollusca TaxID=85980 RepID=A0ACB8BFR7_9AGAM|nr:acyl-CoA N-acyltransferase [Leucogyrophana mollusca]
MLLSRSNHVKLVPPTESDDEAVSVLRSDPITRRYLRFLPEKFTVEDARILRESLENNDSRVDFYVHVIDGDDGTEHFAGTCGLMRIDARNDRCDIGILISPHYHGRGIATEVLRLLLGFAFEDKGMHRVGFETGEDNVAMRGWLERVAGCQLECTWVESWKEGPGRYSNGVWYRILAQEWREAVRVKLDQKLSAKNRGRCNQDVFK